MQWLILGVGLVVALALLLRWFTSATPGDVMRVLRWSGAAAAGAFLLLLAFTGRLGLLWVIAMALIPWLSRLRFIARMLKAARGPSPGQRSQVRTRYLAMELDHDTGAMDGNVLAGPFRGRRLSQMGEEDLFALLSHVLSDDPQSASVLEAYLDRVHGADWRSRAEGADHAFGLGEDAAGWTGRGSGGGQAPMTAQEAYSVLGLRPGATVEEIKRHHRELMKKFHPDRGGSDYLAARINEAKAVLLEENG